MQFEEDADDPQQQGEVKPSQSKEITDLCKQYDDRAGIEILIGKEYSDQYIWVTKHSVHLRVSSGCRAELLQRLDVQPNDTCVAGAGRTVNGLV